MGLATRTGGLPVMAPMQQVADKAGVSIATVSFVVNGKRRVAPATERKVRAAMQELKFRGNVLARALASRRTRIIALLFPVASNRLSSTTSEFFMGAAERASECGYHLVLWPVDPDGLELSNLISSGLVDGVILMEVRLDDPRVALLRTMDVPLTLIGRTRNSTELPFVDIDFEETVKSSIDYLSLLGRNRLGLILEDLQGSSMTGYAPHHRVESVFVDEVRNRGFTGSVIYAGSGGEGGELAALDLLKRQPDVNGVVIMKEDSVNGLVQGMLKAGKHIPDGVSIINLASTRAVGEQTVPKLTTMIAPGRQLGAEAASSLIEQLESGDAVLRHVLMPCVLHVSDSTAVLEGSGGLA